MYKNIMIELSRHTLVNLSKLMARIYNHSELDILMYEQKLEGKITGYNNKLSKSRKIIEELEKIANAKGDYTTILEITEKTLREADGYEFNKTKEYEELLDSIEIDGFKYENKRLIPTTPTPIDIAPEISKLETQLDDISFNVALTHYQQSIDNYVKGNWEASNGQIRSFMEDFLVSLGKKVTSNDRTNPTASIQDLKNKNLLDNSEFNQIKAFWDGIQDNGPHSGLSNKEEALFRLHMSTIFARYLLQKFGTV